MLYLVPTPIGNLGDISLRALEIIKASSLIICEDTRVAKSLLAKLELNLGTNFGSKRFCCLNSHNADVALSSLTADDLNQAIYLSDAGMPCISDPGSELVNYARSLEVPISVLPGASASLCALAASGFSDKSFYFHGFLNIKKNRLSELEALLLRKEAVILYEAPTRIKELIEQIAKLAPQKELHAVKEISKLHETHFHASAADLVSILESANLKGEWVVVLAPNESANEAKLSSEDIYELDLAPKIKAKLLSKINGKSVKENYEELQLR